MKGRSPGATLAASPTMVGAVTTLILIVAVFLAYNANNGLPFVPVYSVSVDVPNAARLGANNEVRIGGTRVGVVESIEPVEIEEGGTASTEGDGTRRRRAPAWREAQPEARQGRRAAARGLGLPGALPLHLRPQVPRDRARHRPGRRGRATSSTAQTTATPPSATSRPIRRASPTTFPSRRRTAASRSRPSSTRSTTPSTTRRVARLARTWWASAALSRGVARPLTTPSKACGRLVENLGPVSRVLADPSTQLERFITSLARTAEIVAPVSDRAGAVLHQRRDCVRRDHARPGGAQGDDLRGAADAGRRRSTRCPGNGRSWRSSPSSRGACARACRTCASHCRS